MRVKAHLLRTAASGVGLFLALNIAADEASAAFVGLSVNGTCDVGTCPATPLPFSTTVSIPFSLNVTLADGDLFNFAGTITGANNSNGTLINSFEDFTAEFVSGPTAPLRLTHSTWTRRMDGKQPSAAGPLRQAYLASSVRGSRPEAPLCRR
jgi:hypothetical protein